jgi:hypothetical protein
VVDSVILNFVHRGKQCTADLLGSDLSNIAWAMARRSQMILFADDESQEARSIMNLTSWVAERALQMMDSQDDRPEAVLQQFQPPELARLMWSLALTVERLSWSTTLTEMDRQVMSKLALLALYSADYDITIFGTEDLVRSRRKQDI